MRAWHTLAVLLLALAVPVPALLAQEEPVAAGPDGVPVPKKTKFVQPVYPPEAAEIPIIPEVQEFELKEANQALILLKQGKIQGAGVLRMPT